MHGYTLFFKYRFSTANYPEHMHMHAQGTKQSVLSVICLSSAQKSLDLNFKASDQLEYNESIKIRKKNLLHMHY